jgi:hypothetical protein
MSLSSFRAVLTALIAAAVLAACGGGHSASPPAAGLTLIPGDSQVTVTWDDDPGVDYWLFFGPASSITPDNWVNIAGSRAIQHVTSPFIVTGLTNGTTYSFSLNGRVDGGPAGPGTPSVSATPRAAGENWVVGGTLDSSDMRAVALGTVAGATSNAYLAVGLGGAMYQSPNGANWAAVTSNESGDLHAAVFLTDKYLVAGSAGRIVYSSDLATWTAANSNTTENLNALAARAGVAVAVGDQGTIRYSSDGVTWFAAATVPTTDNLYGVTFSPTGVWLAVGAGGTMLKSADANVWTAVDSGSTVDLRGVAVLTTFPNLVTTYTFAAAGTGGTILTSSDGTNWTSQTVGSGPNFNALVAWTQFAAVGAGGVAYTSIDGTTWTSRSTGVTADLYGLTAVAGQYTAVGDGGVSAYSQ